MMKKILFISDSYNPNGGGAEKVFFTLKNNLDKNKNFEIYTLSFGVRKSRAKNLLILKESGNVFIRFFWRIFLNPIKYFQISNHIKKVNPDIIHLQNINKYTISILRALPKKVKVIYSVHDYGLICPTLWNVHNDLSPCSSGFNFKDCFWKHKRNYNILTYLILIYFFYKRKNILQKKINLFVTATQKLSIYLNKQGFKKTKIVPYPVEFKNKTNYDFDKIEGNSFLYGGQLEENKGLKVLLDEFILAFKKDKSLKLNIAGTGSLEKELKLKVTKLGLNENIKFLGWVNLNNYYKKNKFLILPSLIQESFGLVIPESMGYYRPVIGSNRGAIPDLIKENKTGFIFNPKKKGDLANVILKASKIDIEKFGIEARKTALEYEPKNYIESYINIYLK